MWRYYNPNPCGRNEPDCAVRALCAALDIDWDTSHKMLCDMSRDMCTMPSSDAPRDAMGRYSGDGYSMHQDPARDLRELIPHAPDEQTRRMMEEIARKMER